MDSKNLFAIGVGVLLAVGIILHAVYPRYEWRVANAEGTAIVIYDRWGGAFQRAAWSEKGDVTPTQPFKPY